MSLDQPEINELFRQS